MTAVIPLYSRASDIKTLLLSGCEGSWLLSHLYAGELPDTTWFILGTACHSTFERTILDNLTLDEALGDVHINLMMAVGDTPNGILEPAARSKRSKTTMKDDAERIVTAWYQSVMPQGDNRHPLFKDYDWPPKVEHEVKLTPKDESRQLFTTVDAIFTGGKFGEGTIPIDWKTGSTKTAAPSQLHTYYFGGRKEGWITEERNLVTGQFWHADHSKAQPVYEYMGDTVVDLWIKRTHDVKVQLLDTGPVFNPEWWCAYCPQKQVCPVMGDGTFKDIGNRVDDMRVIYSPDEKEEG